MPTMKEQFESAKAYIKAKKYDDARRILKKIDHPTADKWLKQLDEKYPQSKFRKSNRIKFWVILIIIATILALIFVSLERQRTANFRLEHKSIVIIL